MFIEARNIIYIAIAIFQEYKYLFIKTMSLINIKKPWFPEY